MVSHWSRYDPVLAPVCRRSDHWAVLRVKAEQQAMPSQDPTMQRSKSAFGVQGRQGRHVTFTSMKTETEPRQSLPPGGAVFSTVGPRSSDGYVPGDYTAPRPSSQTQKNPLRTMYNQKARENQAYWYQDRPKPTSFGRYGIGSYKTFLGIGMGPRT